MTRASGLALVAATLLLPAMAAADGRHLDLEVRRWSPELEGQVRVPRAGLEGSRIDFAGDLGIGDEEFLDLRLRWYPSRTFFVRLAHTPIDYSGDRVVTRTLEFGGVTFPISARVASELNLDYTRAAAGWQFLNTDEGAFRLGPTLGVALFSGDAALSAPDLPRVLSERESFDVAFPLAGAALDVELTDAVHLFGEASVVFSDDGELIDLEAGVRYFFFGRIALMGGWRSLTVDAEDGDERLDVDVEGLFFGLTLRF